MKIMFIDLRRAHLNAKVDQAQDIYVELWLAVTISLVSASKTN